MRHSDEQLAVLNSHAQEEIQVRGLVQGVGFRPTAWRLAQALDLCGSVCNRGDSVQILLQGSRESRDQYVRSLQAECPPLGRIDSLTRRPVSTAPQTQFVIVESRSGRHNTALVADAASCALCVAEAMDTHSNPANRRRGYAFGNCTHCGPRLSISQRLPYDRGNTSMAAFTLCAACQAEYDKPADRRFHAQPTACPDCGPQLWLHSSDGDEHEQPIAAAANRLRSGEIVAIKSTGGFQLAVDAHNAASIAELRRRKNRPHKPFALMVASLQEALCYCTASPEEREALQSSAAPIVLLQRRADCTLPEDLAPGLSTLGLMLAHSPLHHLLLRAAGGPLLMTSGNSHGDAQCIDNNEARERLHGIADCWLLHDRDIVQRLDDSVLRLIDGQVRLLRRARGYAPQSLPAPPGFAAAKPILAVGGTLKNTLCLMQRGQCVLTQHLGDLQTPSIHDDFERCGARYAALFDHQPSVIAADLHADYFSSRWASEQSAPVLAVQHHHAHAAACLGDNAYPLHGAPVLAITLDGSGLGDDDTLWGGELLLCDYRQYQRLAWLSPAPLPGGAQCMQQPWRNLLARLHACPQLRDQIQQLPALQGRAVSTLERMIDNNINAPLSSSVGRLFDAVAALLGLCAEQQSFEGQAAMALEQAAMQNNTADHYPLPLQGQTLDPAPMLQALLDDLSSGASVALMARRFHNSVAQGFCQAALALREQHRFSSVALSGGVFQNRLLSEQLATGLRAAGLTVLQHRQVPCNDGGLSFGQALVAAARQLESPQESSPCA